MNKKLQLDLLKFGIPLLIIAFLAILPRTLAFQSTPEDLSLGILFDLIITIPIVYFLFIRNTSTPKFTLLYVILIGMILASFIIPIEHQALLSKIKLVAIPLIELGIISTIIYKFRNLTKSYKNNQSEENDFYDNLLIACNDIFPNRVGKVLAMEISVVYYLFFSHKAKKIKENEFTYFRKSGIKTVVGVFLFLLAIETFIVHILVAKWNHQVAWVLSFLGAYTALQIIAILKSMNKRLISIDFQAEKLNLKYGFGCQTSIPFNKIKSIEKSSQSLENDKKNVSLSLFDLIDPHNLIIHLNEEQTLHKIYGIEKKYESISVFIDDKDVFINKIDAIISSTN